jgi:hypothetical protein
MHQPKEQRKMATKNKRTKSEILVSLMARKQGATMGQLQAAVRRKSFISVGRHVAARGMKLVRDGERYFAKAR